MLIAKMSYASVKKPTPATMQTFTWNHLQVRACERPVSLGGYLEEAEDYSRELGLVDLGKRSTALLIESVAVAGNGTLAELGDGLVRRAR